MFTLFVVCFVLGSVVLLLQFGLGLLGADHGLDHDAPDPHAGHAAAGLDLLSVRAVSAGVAFFGVAGWGLLAAGAGSVLAVAGGLLAGFAAAAAVAAVMRSLFRLESDGTVRIESALGESGTVYLPIPADRSGTGKVLLTVQNRTVELQAVTRHGPLATGTRVTVVDVVDQGTVEVVVTPHLGELLDG